jgi:oligopeptide transport system substrate-binding protein
MDEYLKEKGITADQITLTLLFNTSEGHKKRAEAVQQMWKDTLGINTTLLNQERAVFFSQRSEGKENVYRGSWVQDYPDANNFMNDVFGKDGGYYDVMDWDSGPEYEKFIQLIQEAALEQDPAKRVDLYVQAETILVMEQAVVAPVYWYSTPQLTNPKVTKIDSITGYDHFEKWDITQ